MLLDSRKLDIDVKQWLAKSQTVAQDSDEYYYLMTKISKSRFPPTKTRMCHSDKNENELAKMKM